LAAATLKAPGKLVGTSSGTSTAVGLLTVPGGAPPRNERLAISIGMGM
jgi:hypothetical protein